MCLQQISIIVIVSYSMHIMLVMFAYMMTRGPEERGQKEISSLCNIKMA